MFEPDEAQVEVVSHVLEDDWKRLPDVSAEQGLEGGSDQCQRTGGVGIVDEAGVLPPLGVAFPVSSFAAPMGANDSDQMQLARLVLAKVAGEMAND